MGSTADLIHQKKKVKELKDTSFEIIQSREQKRKNQ